jgi:FSR family fosmidomycin resistance protein-like MFS transporter
MAQEIVPQEFGLVSGLMVGFATGAGSLGVAVSGLIADMFGPLVSMAFLSLVLLAAAGVFQCIDYPCPRERTP